MKRYIVYINKVIKHKYFVFLACLKLKVPLYLAIMHDISKFSLEEFIPYARYFYDENGNPNPIKNNHGEYDYTKQGQDFHFAWLYHINRNKHHWNYWAMIKDDSSVVPMQIPSKYIKEMVADWIGAAKVYNPDVTVQSWYEKEKNNLIFHNDTRKQIEEILGILEEN